LILIDHYCFFDGGGQLDHSVVGCDVKPLTLNVLGSEVPVDGGFGGVRRDSVARK